MAPSPLSLLLRHVSRSPRLHSYRLRHFPLYPLVKHFSLSSPKPSDPQKHSTLSSRFSFVFEQIDEIERERAEKDNALQRIKAWRESKKPKRPEVDASAEGTKVEGEELGLVSTTLGNDDPAAERGLGRTNLDKARVEGLMKKEVELSHPWPEWIEFMERLVQQNYFDHRRTDEDKVIEGLGLDSAGVAEEGFDFTKDWKGVHTAVLNFGRDRFDIFRYLSRQDIQILVGYGCASTDRKVVFSSKLLRKHVHLDEGDVCSSCTMRSSCDKAYLLTNKEDEARTIDVVRVLLTYGFEPINGSVANKSLLKKKSVKTVVRKLLHEVVKHSSVPIDPNLPPPIIKKRPPKVKQPPPPPRRRIGRDDIEMKKGDWLCPKCDFMNFAKNAICLQCDAKRPKRQLLPGEWGCPQCNFLNYRRNMACFHCEHKRPPDEYTDGPDGPHGFQERRRGSTTRPERVVNREEFSNAWNFNFDDDESDGADVAAFENADAHEGQASGNRVESAQPKRPGDDFHPTERNPRAQDHAQGRRGTGFDDFDDEEDDDVDNYELEDASRGKREETSSVNLSDVEGYSTSEEDEVLLSKNHRVIPRARNKSAASRGGGLSGSDDDDIGFGSEDDLPVHPKWKSSHVADSRPNFRTPRRNRSFDSDEEDVGLPSGSDDDVMGGGARSRGGRGNRWGSDRRESSRGGGLKARTNERGLGKGDFGGRRLARGFEREEFGSDNDDVMDGGLRSRAGRGNGRDSNRKRGGGLKPRADDRGFSGRRRAGGSERGGFGNSRQGGRGGRFGGQQGWFRESRDEGDFADERPTRTRVNVR